jgi:2-(1,2-epoxy-1,2-dihydrophenyl)acetyl-CoA isomerase
MASLGTFGDVMVELGDDFVAKAEIGRPPDNFFDRALIAAIADALEMLDKEPACRVVLLCSAGKHFCAGADFRGRPLDLEGGRHLYDEALRMFGTRKPIVAAPEARFSANFARLGFHHGFGISVTLPRVVGEQRALELLYTGTRLSGEDALAIGLCDRLAPLEALRDQAHAFAAEIAASGPLAIESIRATMRGDLQARIQAALAHERAEQERLQASADFREGVRAMADRRPPHFTRS